MSRELNICIKKTISRCSRNNYLTYNRIETAKKQTNSSKFLLCILVVPFLLFSSPLQEISASAGAFAALRRDGRVVTWGDPEDGADCDLGGRGRRWERTVYLFIFWSPQVVNANFAEFSRGVSRIVCRCLQIYIIYIYITKNIKI